MAPGSIVVNSKQNVLFYVLGNGKAVKYRVATARKGFEWSGTNKVSFKTEWPDWRPPTEMRARHPELPAFMAGGPKNPLGARAIYLGSSIYRIHGTNEPSSIGKSASSGCIRMLNEDVTELYQFVKHGAVRCLIRQNFPVAKASQGFNDPVEAFFGGFAHMPGAHEGMGQRRFFFQDGRNSGGPQLFIENHAVIIQRVMGGD